jgi:hypothetical protein
MNSTTCGRCHRPLTSEESVARGYGKHCWSKIQHAAVTAKTETIAKAVELIEDSAIIRIRPTVFRTVSTNGQETYLSHPTNCTCPAGRNGRICYHQIAAQMLLAA